MKADRILESLESDLNSNLAIPTDVWITVGECGTYRQELERTPELQYQGRVTREK